ncbi:MAG: Gfo/Idh/MocA family oxidoreductase [Lentisphaerota bacterium]
MSIMKIGMIGLDTSHCPAFVKLLNDSANEFHIAGAKVEKAFPGGSKDFSLSHSRVGQFTEELKALGVEICDSLEGTAKDMDAFFLESVDGRQHLEQFKELAKFGKPVFIDKPFACSFEDAKAIVEISREKNVPVMTASAIRFAKGIGDLLEAGEVVQSCDAFGPMAVLSDYRDYFWYGIHSAEVLYAMMGKGCLTVRTFNTGKIDVIVGMWDDGRIGSLRGNRTGANNFGCVVTTNKIAKAGFASGEIPYYALMLRQVIPFFQTGKSPICLKESLEVIAFLEAASQSLVNGGKTINIMK